jgi:SagB-type dehydrogenase family enzyme
MGDRSGPAFQYHEEVSYDRRAMEGHFLDWANQPRVEKVYPGCPTQELTREPGFPELGLGQALEGRPEPAGGPKPTPELTPERLSRILYSAYGVSARARQPGGELLLRTAPSAGALYPCEVYLGLAETEAQAAGLKPGLYHYRPQTHGLTRLRSGRLGLGETVFFITVIPFRSAWKYRARAFRYCCLDTGHLAENLLLALGAEGYGPGWRLELEEERVNSFLGVDPRRESCLAVVGLNGRPSLGELPPAGEPALASESRVSERERTYPPLEEILAASTDWRETGAGQAGYSSAGESLAGLGLPAGEPRPLPGPEGCREGLSLGQATAARRSRRNFIKADLDPSCLGYLARLMRAEGAAAFRVGLLVKDGSGLEEGFYLLDRTAETPALIRPGDLRARMAAACLDQAWLRQAAFHFLFLADLDRLEQERGPGGYREAMILAGRLGQRLYLGATGLGLGCCGVGAFYDGEVGELLWLKGASRMLYLVAVGPIKG